MMHIGEMNFFDVAALYSAAIRLKVDGVHMMTCFTGTSWSLMTIFCSSGVSKSKMLKFEEFAMSDVMCVNFKGAA